MGPSSFGEVTLTPADPALAGAVEFGPNLRTMGWSAVSFPGIPAASLETDGSDTLEVAAGASPG